MFLFIDMESPVAAERPALAQRWAAHTLAAKYAVEEVCGDPCLIVRHDRFDPDMPARLGVRAVLIGGHFTEVGAYPSGARDAVLAWAADPDRPVLGLCGGHQLIAEAHGGATGPISTDPAHMEGVPCPSTIDYTTLDHDGPGARFGYLPVELTEHGHGHPLFAGLPPSPRLLHLHYWHVARLPEGFVPLARSADGVVQAMAHESRPIFGVQSHPEGFLPSHPDGRLLLERFLHTDWSLPGDFAALVAADATGAFSTHGH